MGMKNEDENGSNSFFGGGAGGGGGGRETSASCGWRATMTWATCSRDLLGVVGLLGCEEPVSHLILQPKLLCCVMSHVDLYFF